ncbi:hypothetical protein FNV43_RR11034 [Rhamnella rubrinervis]|uniref:Uncharacterized protein n=1 Tax=Rhamnella rubrinervis TaxID=2594499 RepID=A0A8K0H4Y5_9ROSA|nr:hypothetical protein FNV43_RR11034 [Rhamnella rubrinervis]
MSNSIITDPPSTGKASGTTGSEQIPISFSLLHSPDSDEFFDERLDDDCYIFCPLRLSTRGTRLDDDPSLLRLRTPRVV